jgi:hypothetical protein
LQETRHTEATADLRASHVSKPLNWLPTQSAQHSVVTHVPAHTPTQTGHIFLACQSELSGHKIRSRIGRSIRHLIKSAVLCIWQDLALAAAVEQAATALAAVKATHVRTALMHSDRKCLYTIALVLVLVLGTACQVLQERIRSRVDRSTDQIFHRPTTQIRIVSHIVIRSVFDTIASYRHSDPQMCLLPTISVGRDCNSFACPD